MRTTFKAVSVVVVLLLSLVLAPTAHAALTAVGAADVPSPPGTGFPAWYQDSTGLSLAPCFDTNGFCPTTMVSAPPGFDATQPLVFPTNFPEELFYYTLFADTVGISDLLWEAAIEGAFANQVQPGDQIVFARIRMRGNVTLPGTYTVTHPYGVETFEITTILPGSPEINFTEDVGVANGIFTGALAGRVGPFVLPVTGLVTAPDGNVYVGNPLTAVAVTGSPFGTNSVTITGPDFPGGATTSLFLVEGKVVGNDVSPKSLTFQPQKTGVASAAQTVTVTNISTTTPLTVAVTVDGTDLNDFQITANNCVAAIPASGTCTFGVTFSSAVGTPAARTASALISTVTPTGMPPMRVALSGTIDSVAPTVIEHFPANTQTVPSNSTITAVFSEPMAAATIGAATFTVTGTAGAVSGTVSYDSVNNTATFIPASLAIGATYTATITTGATDLAGNGLAADHVFTFTTVAPDTTRPQVVSMSPAANSIAAPLNTTIQVTFDEEMHAASINASTFLVSNGVVASSITFDTATKTATFTPSVRLTAGTAYTVTIKGGAGGVDDLAQNTLLNDHTWTFVTNHAPAAPALISPDDGSTGHGTSVTLTWAKSTDDDGDAIIYHVEVCQNQFFIGCEHKEVPLASAPRLNGAYLAGMGGLGMAVLGLVSFGGLTGRKRFMALLIVGLLVSGAVVTACGKDKTTTVVQTSSAEVSYTATGLNPGALYFWRIEAHDPNGGSGMSDTRTFRTQ
jgi:hypothetical protein